MSDKKILCINTLIEMSKTIRLDDITVLTLAETAGVKRTTFYYNFSSIRDVVRCYFLAFPLTNTHLIGDIKRLIEAITHRLDDDNEFIINLITQRGYRDVVFEVVYAWSLLYFKKVISDKTKSSFVAAGFAQTLIDIYGSKEKNYLRLENIIKAI